MCTCGHPGSQCVGLHTHKLKVRIWYFDEGLHKLIGWNLHAKPMSCCRLYEPWLRCDLDSLHFVQSSQNQGSGQQCCYDDRGEIVTGQPGGGTVDLVAPVDEDSREQHFDEDVRPFLYCCKLASNCREYYRHRPSDNCSRYCPPVPGTSVISVKPLHIMLHNWWFNKQNQSNCIC